MSLNRVETLCRSTCSPRFLLFNKSFELGIALSTAIQWDAVRGVIFRLWLKLPSVIVFVLRHGGDCTAGALGSGR